MSEKLSIAKQIVKSANERVDKAKDLAMNHPELVSTKNDVEAETESYKFRDGSELLIEPHHFEES